MTDLADRCREQFERLIGPLRDLADQLGYAIAVHGSMARDIDLVAVPWKAAAVSAEELVEAIIAETRRLNGGVAFLTPVDAAQDFFRAGMPGAKPHGRRCWSIHLGGGPYIDLSIMPRDGEKVMPFEVARAAK